MELFTRYVRTVRWLLPREQRDDIVNELTEEYREQVATREREIGRPLTTDEQAAVIARFGHPLVIAARYRTPRHVIGPIVFPWYWLLLKAVVAAAIGERIIQVAVLLYREVPMPPVATLVLDAIGAVLRIVGWLTFLTAMFELWLAKSRWLERWTPRLPGPPLQQALQTARHAAQVVDRSVHGKDGRHE